MNATEELQRGLTHHKAGRFGDARRCYERIFAVQADHSRALELAGLASLAMGQSPVGIAFLERASATSSPTAETFFHLSTAYFAAQRWTHAIEAARKACALKPDLVEGWCAIGMIAERLNRWDEAEQAYHKALALRPNFAEAYCNLGGICLKKLDYPGAETAFAHALEFKPEFPEALNGLGVARKQRGEFELASEHFQRALRLRPAYSEALYNLANVWQAQEKWAEATQAYRQVLLINPKAIEAAHNLACALISQREFVEALAYLREVIAAQPEHADAYNHLGNALLGLDRFAEAKVAYEKALSLRPRFVDALCNLGNVHLAENQPEAALKCLATAREIDPNSVSVEFNTSIALLVSGRWLEGLQKYERRWDTEQKSFRKNRPEPLWLGRENLEGKSILLHSEQGIGDTLQFVRYASVLASMGATVSLQVQDPVKALLENFPKIAAVYSKFESPTGFDCQCPLGSLPLALRIEPSSIPVKTPYLFADAEKLASWQKKLSEAPASSRIGLVCSGNARHKNDHHRSIPLSAFAEIANAVGAPLHLVQRDFRSSDAVYLAKAASENIKEKTVLATSETSSLFIDWSEELTDFRETAALVQALDLVITVDTSVAHLAGAMGKPTWILLPFAPDWRWLLNRTDTPWYPTVRLFRQKTPGDWAGVLREVAEALKGLKSLKTQG